MSIDRLEQRLVEQWQQAAVDLGITVTAPVELRDASGEPFQCEAFVHDFGSPTGAVVVSPKTERRLRGRIRDELSVCRSERRVTGYNRKHFIDELLDWGWFGKPGAEPSWYSERMPSAR